MLSYATRAGVAVGCKAYWELHLQSTHLVMVQWKHCFPKVTFYPEEYRVKKMSAICIIQHEFCAEGLGGSWWGIRGWEGLAS